MIAVGDPQQNQPVGAGGLWHHIEHTTRTTGAHQQLTRNQRARDPADRCDQALFRNGHSERAIRGYAARDRVHLHPTEQNAEDQALDAAHADRINGLATMVIAQTSNDHLDALNARAQAIRRQTGQLGTDSLPIPRRPYQLHAGDLVQIRHTIKHLDHGPLRNGTTAQITAVHPHTRELDLQLVAGTTLDLDQQQATAADLRLAYVQHPFPAQGQTTDTTHLIIDPHATREGSYVGLTRAREATHIYAANASDPASELDRLQDLADHMSRAEPDVPSIDTPLAHETTIAAHASESIEPSPTADRREHHPDPGAEPSPKSREERAAASSFGIEANRSLTAGERDSSNMVDAHAEPTPGSNTDPEPAASRHSATPGREEVDRRWPLGPRDPLTLNSDKDEPDHAFDLEL